jgi:hypothetical protein
MQTTTQPTTITHRPINSHQFQLLTTLYKFRFITAQLIASSQQAKHKRVIAIRLKILVDQGYIGMNYESSYRLQGKPASYYLLPKAIQVLRKQAFADSNVLKRAYYDKNQDDTHIQHRLNVFKAYVYIKQYYPKQFQFYSKSELASWKHIPKDITDAYLKRNDGSMAHFVNEDSEVLPAGYFLSFYDATAPFWRHRNSIKRYIAYAESDSWQKATKQDFPTVLMICETKELEQRMQGLIERELDTTGALIKFVSLVINP